MARTVKGGESPHQVASRTGQKLIPLRTKQKRQFESLRDGGNKPKVKLGPLNLRERT